MSSPMNIRSAIARAQQRAADSGESMAVVEIDSGDGRQLAICPEAYLDGDEFLAFDGKLLEIVTPYAGTL